MSVNIFIHIVFFASLLILTIRFMKMLVSKREESFIRSLLKFFKKNQILMIPIFLVLSMYTLMYFAFYSFDNPSINLEGAYSKNFSTPFKNISDIEGYILGGIDFNHNLFFQSPINVELKNKEKFTILEDSLSKYWKAERFRRAAESRSYKKYSEALKNIDVDDLIIKDYIKVSEKDSTRNEYYYHYMKIKSKGLYYFNYGDF